MNWMLVALLAVLVTAGAYLPALAAAAAVEESARRIPVAYEVDVVVVGGTSGGVAAAEAAAQAGAKVFLAAPRPYLGEDLCATMRLWLEEGEAPATPLAKRLFSAEADAPAAFKDADALPFRYEADLPSSAKHKDTSPPSLLTDGRFARPESESVQYDGDVTVTCDLGSPQAVREARIVLFQRDGGDFNPQSVTLQTSQDKKAWKDVATLACDKPQGGLITAAAPVGASVRYARFLVKKSADATRVLVGEIVLLRPAGAPAPAPAPAPASAVHRGPIRPLHVKKTLDEALLAAKADFLTGCCATDVLRDEAGQVCGIVMANRAGRQAVLARMVIDATDRAWVARMAGARFAPYPGGPQVFQRVVVGGEPVQGRGLSARAVGLAYAAAGRSYNIYEYTLTLPMKDGSWASLAAADQAARDLTWHVAQVDDSEVLFQVPPDPMKGRASAAGPWPGADAANLDAFRPAGVDRVYVVGGCADVSREAAARLLRPVETMAVGARVGRAAAAEAKALPAPRGARVAGARVAGAAPGEVREMLGGLRPTDRGLATVPSEARPLPVVGRFDVVVVGGGTGGAPAGIGAGREKARTLVVEYLTGLGGVGTLGMISKYYHGYRGGFTAEVDAGVKELGAANEVVGKTEWWRRANRQAGAELWFGALACGALVEGSTVKGVVVATPEGRGVVLAKTTIDATGNADVAAAAGAACEYTGGEHIGVQGAGLPPLNLGAGYTNTDYTFADDTDPVDFWHLFVYAREKFKGAYDLGQLVDTRERRRIVGDVTISPMDMMLDRTWPDAISIHKSNFDSHGFTVHPMFLLRQPGREGMTVYVPLRALLPKGMDGILVTGLSASAHRDAVPVIRMQPCVQNQGYAAGVAAAQVAHSAGTIRSVDVQALQKHLVAKGCLPEEALGARDSLPLPKPRVAQAVQAVADGYKDLEVVLVQPDQSVPLLKQAYQAATTDDSKRVYAHILGMLGDPTGADALIAAVRAAAQFDKGWNYTGMGQFGMSLSPLDSYLIALGRTRDPRALAPVLEKVALLDASKEFSHHRACAMALETLGDPRAAPALAELLAKPGMTGYWTTTVEEAKRLTGPSGTETKPRSDSLRELHLARALYRCGDHGGLGAKVLGQYAKDLRGHYARHARAVLDEKKTN